MFIKQSDGGNNAQLAVNSSNVQKQRGSSDCAIFAIAFALHSVSGLYIEKVAFNQAEMRSHLVKCFIERTCSLHLI